MIGLVICTVIVIIIVICMVIKNCIEAKRNAIRDALKEEILDSLNIGNYRSLLKVCDDTVYVKSAKSVESYNDIKYIKEKRSVEDIRKSIEQKLKIKNILFAFLKKNEFEGREEYDYVASELGTIANKSADYIVQIEYNSPSGRSHSSMLIHISLDRLQYLSNHPEFFMTKGEYNKLLKEKEKEEIEEKKHKLYDRVNSIIDFANDAKGKMIVKSQINTLDTLIDRLFEKTVNSIQNIKKMDSEEWDVISNFITNINEQITAVVKEDTQLRDYYESDDFEKIKTTCELLMQSQKEFNEYIDEKANSITKLFGTRIIRNETQTEDTYNYIRKYKKSITPFVAEVSSSVFGSAENNPIAYVIKYFYPNKRQYKEQIDKLRTLIEELETLSDAKVIIDNYKKEYSQYIKDVPKFVLEKDEDGFYHRLGLTIIDESILNVEYKFVYTSNGGMAQRSFTVPMSEENIAELILQLENKLTRESFVKEQRALMTKKLRNYIKERDNYTCCICGNSTFVEPNLLLEVDHKIPVSKGGITEETNLQTLCWKCNRNKGAKLL